MESYPESPQKWSLEPWCWWKLTSKIEDKDLKLTWHLLQVLNRKHRTCISIASALSVFSSSIVDSSVGQGLFCLGGENSNHEELISTLCTLTLIASSVLYKFFKIGCYKADHHLNSFITTSQTRSSVVAAKQVSGSKDHHFSIKATFWWPVGGRLQVSLYFLLKLTHKQIQYWFNGCGFYWKV